MSDQKTYGTVDLYLASFLRAAGNKLLDIEKSGRRITFLFPDTKDVQRLVREFYNNDAVVRVNDFTHALKDLKSIVFNSPWLRLTINTIRRRIHDGT